MLRICSFLQQQENQGCSVPWRTGQHCRLSIWLVLRQFDIPQNRNWCTWWLTLKCSGFSVKYISLSYLLTNDKAYSPTMLPYVLGICLIIHRLQWSPKSALSWDPSCSELKNSLKKDDPWHFLSSLRLTVGLVITITMLGCPRIVWFDLVQPSLQIEDSRQMQLVLAPTPVIWTCYWPMGWDQLQGSI